MTSGATGPNRSITKYDDFWPYYLHEHSRRATRTIHLIGTVTALLAVGSGLATGKAWYFALALVGGYGPAWFAHFFVEKNRPATFSYPLWSLICDFRMAWCWLTGTLERELIKAGADSSTR